MGPALPWIAACRPCLAASLVLSGAGALDCVCLRMVTSQRRWTRPRRFSTQALQRKALDPDKMMKMLPPKPEPPSNDDCCMSGCEFCVWDLYDEDMREYQKHAVEAREAFEAQGRPMPDELRPEKLRDSIDPSMRAFLDNEREMAIRIQQEEQENNDD